MVLSLARSCGFALVARSQQLLRVANRAPCPVTRLSATSAFGPRSCSSHADSRVSVLAISEMTSRVCSQHAVLAARAAVPYVEPNALVAPILSPRPRPAQSDAAEQRCVTELCQRGARSVHFVGSSRAVDRITNLGAVSVLVLCFHRGRQQQRRWPTQVSLASTSYAPC